MRARVLAAIGLLAAAIGAGYVIAGQERRPPGTGEPQRKVDLTIYHEDFALVHEERAVQVSEDARRAVLADVSKQLDPQSVLLGWREGAGGGRAILGHTYDLGARNRQSLLAQRVGQTVEVIRYGDSGREASRERGRLLVVEQGRPAAIEVGGKVYVDPRGTVVVDADGGAPMVPQLTVQVGSGPPQAGVLDLTYLTRGLRWSADYVTKLSPTADDRLDLECYATVTNRTGVEYPDARVTLAAGSPSRAVRTAAARAGAAFEGRPATPALSPVPRARRKPAGMAWGAASIPESVAGFHAYPLKERAMIRSEQLTRLLMVQRPGMRVRSHYSYRAPDLDAWSSPQEALGAIIRGLSFRNTSSEGLGVPMPAGAVRVYDPGRSGQMRYAGAAHIPPTPRNGSVSVTLAEAFDVTAEYRTVSSKKVGKREVRKEIQVRVRNERPGPVKVRVVQGFYGGWKVAWSSDAFTKPNSSTAQWVLGVPAGGARTLRFAVDLARW